MPGNDKKQTTTTTNEPFPAAKPLYNTAMGDAMKLYNKGNLVPSNNMSTVVPWSSQSKTGMNAIEQNARSAMGDNSMDSVLGQMGGIWGNGGLTSQQMTAMGALNPLLKNGGLTQQQQNAMGALNPMMTGGGYNAQQKTALDALNPVARGDFLNRTDPNFEAVLARTKENAGTDVNSMMSGMGRFAGGSHQGILADTLGGIESSARLNQYNLERDRQTNAANQLFGMGQTGQSNVANAANSIFGMGQTGQGNLATGAGALFGMGQTGQANLSNAGDVWSNLLAGKDAPANALLGVGSMHEDLSGRKLNDKLRMADGKVNDLRTLLGIAGGAGGYGTQRAQMPTQSNGLSNAMGAGLGGLSLLQMLGAF